MKLIALILCFPGFPSATGQKHCISVNYKPSLSYFGKQNQDFGTHYFSSRSGNRTYGTAADILYGYSIFRNVSVTTGAEYSQQGQNINFNLSSGVTDYTSILFKTELNYLRIPLIINYSLLKNKKNELSIYSGASLGIVTKRKDNYQDIILENILLPTAEKRYKDKDWAIPIGINYRRVVKAGIFVSLGAEYMHGLTDAFSKKSFSKFGVLSQFDNSKQNRLSLSLGGGFWF
jgi:Outer membrane protein beta-barrel domain